jgi:hypothetical protein
MPTIKPTKKIKSLSSFSSVGLPTEICKAISNPSVLKILAAAPPGWGKTEFMMSNPDALLLAFEEGHAFVSGYKIIIDAWDDTKPWTDKNGVKHNNLMGVIEDLKETDRFRTIIIDTVDAMVKILLDYMLPKKKVEHASELGDYGKGWDVAQNTPFRRALNEILKTGRGIGAITHTDVTTANFKSGGKSKKETTLPKGIYKQIYAQFDLILHGRFGNRIKGRKVRQRLVQTEGSEEILAKNRGGILPPAFIVSENFEERWKEFNGFFTDKKSKDAAFQKFLDAGYELD